MSAPYESLLAEVFAQIGDRDPTAYPHQLCDSILNHAWSLEHEMFSSSSEHKEIRRKAICVAVDAIRIAREMEEEPGDGC